MKKIIISAIFFGMSMIPQSVVASVIYNNGEPDLLNGYPSDDSYGYHVADNFSLEVGSNTITDIHWWGFYSDNQAVDDDFSIFIYETSASADLPGALAPSGNIGNVSVDRSDTDLIALDDWDIYFYSVYIDPVSLTAGETYWLEIYNNTGTWFWATSDFESNNVFAFWAVNLGSWFNDAGEYAFYLTDDTVAPIPEPSTFLLLGGGLAGLALVVRRRKKE